MISPLSSDTPADRPARARRTAGGARDGAESAVDATKVPGTSPRPANLRRSSPLMRAGMLLFCIGASALLVMLVLFAGGARDFPLWFWSIIALAPLGLAIAAFRIRREGLSVGSVD